MHAINVKVIFECKKKYSLLFQKDVSLANDELLGDLMADLHKGPDTGIKPVPIKLKKKSLGSSRYSIFLVHATQFRKSLNEI